MSFKFSERSMVRMIGVNPDLVKVAHRALGLSPIDFGIPALGGLRTADEQYKLYQEKASQLDGFQKKSYHQTGNALDVYAYVHGRASWDELHLTTIAAAMLQAASELGVKLEWGGHWRSFKDMPHFQIPE